MQAHGRITGLTHCRERAHSVDCMRAKKYLDCSKAKLLEMPHRVREVFALILRTVTEWM